MDNSNAVAAAFVAADGVIDKLELNATGALSPTDVAFLTAYQAVLASGNTTPQDDLRFLGILEKFWLHDAATRKVG